MEKMIKYWYIQEKKIPFTFYLTNLKLSWLTYINRFAKPLISAGFELK